MISSRPKGNSSIEHFQVATPGRARSRDARGWATFGISSSLSEVHDSTNNFDGVIAGCGVSRRLIDSFP